MKGWLHSGGWLVSRFSLDVVRKSKNMHLARTGLQSSRVKPDTAVTSIQHFKIGVYILYKGTFGIRYHGKYLMFPSPHLF
jgi:hypothetical protein